MLLYSSPLFSPLSSLRFVTDLDVHAADHQAKKKEEEEAKEREATEDVGEGGETKKGTEGTEGTEGIGGKEEEGGPWGGGR